MKAESALSLNSDSRKAALEVSNALFTKQKKPVFAVVFTTENYDHQIILDTIKEKFGNISLCGMCVGGIIYGSKVFTEAIAVLMLSGDELRIVTTLQENLSKDPFEVGIKSADDLLRTEPEDGLVLAFPDGFSANIAETVRGLYSNMGPSFQFIGGGAGDNLKFFKTFQFTESGIKSDAIALALINGLNVKVGVGHGWLPYGEPLVITSAKGKKIFEIDGKPAFEAYKDRIKEITFENFNQFGMKYPLGFTDLHGQYFIRDPLSVTAEDGSIDCVSEVPNNALGNIMQGEVHLLTETAVNVSKAAREKIDKPEFALICDCISRYLLMGKDFENELIAVHNVIGKNVPMVGALTFGEIGSLTDVPFLHNKTIAIAVCGSQKS